MSRRSLLLSLAAALFLAVTLIALVFAVIVALRDRGGSALGLGSGRIAVLEVDGLISDDRKILEDIARFRKDGSVRGYVVSINSPGGVVGPAQSIYEELRRLRREGKPVVASIGGTGASGGYYVALAADTIYALPGSMTGSIGVIMEMPDASGLMKKVGIGWNVVKSAEHKDIGSPFRPMTRYRKGCECRIRIGLHGGWLAGYRVVRHERQARDRQDSCDESIGRIRGQVGW